ncbi:MAG: hypothetical protein ACFFEN_08200 [Candidatus Thorarchaeota archaeon]
MVNFTFLDDARDKNILSGLLLIDVIAFICYLIFPSGLIYLGDVQMTIGCIIGTRFALKNIKLNQSYLSTGLVVGLCGSVLTGISFSLFEWIAFSSSLFVKLIIFELFLLEAIIVGIVIGGIFGGYYSRSKKKKIKEPERDQKFYKSLERK